MFYITKYLICYLSVAQRAKNCICQDKMINEVAQYFKSFAYTVICKSKWHNYILYYIVDMPLYHVGLHNVKLDTVKWISLYDIYYHNTNNKYGCVIGDTTSLSNKNNIKCIYFDTPGSSFIREIIKVDNS